MNAHCERFNRSIQESFVDYNEDLLFTDLALFNQKMSDWLVFYNTELPHLSTKPNPKKTTSLTNLPVSPIEFLLKSHPQSRMYWTNSGSGQSHWNSLSYQLEILLCHQYDLTGWKWSQVFSAAGAGLLRKSLK